MEVLLHSAERKRYFTNRCDLENAVLVSFPLHTLHTSVYYYQLTVLQISATLSLGGSIGIGSIDLEVNQLGLPILSLRRPIHLIRGQLKQRLNLKIYSPLTAILLTGGVCVGGGQYCVGPHCTRKTHNTLCSCAQDKSSTGSVEFAAGGGEFKWSLNKIHLMLEPPEEKKKKKDSLQIIETLRGGCNQF